MTPRTLHVAQILWPAFLIAAVMEMVVFAWVDPAQLRFGSWHPDPNTAYSLAFLVFWSLVTISSAISHWLMKQPIAPRDVGINHRLET
jgi:hypothetical protein